MNESGIFQVYTDGRRIYTENLVPGKKVYEERLVRTDGTEYREWDPTRSKLGALIKKGCRNIFLRKNDVVLYLGAATGTTVSHVSDIVGKDGFVFGLDFAPRVVRELVYLSEERKNIAPILADANQPMQYLNRICGVDFIFQDIAQRNQTEIFLKNFMFLKKGGYGILAVKSRSVDIKKSPKQVFKETRSYLEMHTTIVDYKELEPFEKDHAVFICKKR